MTNWQAFKLTCFLLIVPILVVMAILFSFSVAGALDEGKYDGPCTGLETAGRCADKRGPEPLPDTAPPAVATPAVPVAAEVPADIQGLK